jgi:hypothetical protein
MCPSFEFQPQVRKPSAVERIFCDIIVAPRLKSKAPSSLNEKGSYETGAHEWILKR